MNSGIFTTKSGFNLIHTEYPTPFKCKTLFKEPYIEIAKINTSYSRSHIDFVLLNPDFVEWILENRNEQDIKYITGLSNEPYQKYIKELETKYSEFIEEFNQQILLYAVEFKFYRHNSTGIESAKKYILYDKEKLTLLKGFTIEKTKLNFCSNVKSLVFIGHRLKDKLHDICTLAQDKDKACEIIEHSITENISNDF